MGAKGEEKEGRERRLSTELERKELGKALTITVPRTQSGGR